MAHLSIRLLGPFQVSLDGEHISSFASDKARALLVYLAMSPDRPHRRETLAGLLWPEFDERSARANLRNTLASLRQTIGDASASPPFLEITRKTIQFNSVSDYWLDAETFERLVSTARPRSEALEQALALVRGPFLAGFSLPDAAPFEEWQRLHQERVHRQVVATHESLSALYENQSAHEQALEHARRRVELDPLQEDGQRQLMRLLARNGQRSAALAQYEACRRLLADELDIEPAAETTLLYEQIEQGEMESPREVPARLDESRSAQRLPGFLVPEGDAVEPPLFVARDLELARLDAFLEQALAGEGQVVFVTGEAGSGKTSLIEAFTRRALAAHAHLIVAGGNCDAFAGIGDPYLPFREILQLLSADVEAAWEAGAMSGEQARRLWNALPLLVQALVESGPDLIGTFILPAALHQRVMGWLQAGRQPEWLTRLQEHVQASSRQPQGVTDETGVTSLRKTGLFAQYTRVLQAVARQAPLVLVIDDLQWADIASISLLFHLGKQLAGSRILILGAYRPEEIASGRDGARHPLEPVIGEFQRDFGPISIALARADGRYFVEALLDSEPNRLDTPFREMLYRQTRGHPLFTTELLRGLQEQGALVKDQEGRWTAGPALDWAALPPRVEAVIGERIGRLAPALRGALRVASVEGEVFTAEVVARVQAADERQVVGWLSRELDKRHRLVRAQGILSTDGQRLSQYRFRHILFQRYLYNRMDGVERAHLHEAVGDALEALHKARPEATAAPPAIAPQLAWHYRLAGVAEKAIGYLYQAGQRAVYLSANEEGIAHLTSGLDMLKALPEPGNDTQRLARAQQELALQLGLGIAWRAAKGYGDEAERAYNRARELCQLTGDTTQHCQVLGKLSILHFVRAEYQQAREFAEEALSLARQANDPLHIALGHWYLGTIILSLGEHLAARTHLRQMIEFYDPQQHHSLVLLRGSDPGLSALAYDACSLWCLGYPEQALVQGQETLALARELGHPMSLIEVLYWAGCLVNWMRRDGRAVRENAEELTQLAHDKAPSWSVLGITFLGEALILQGQAQEGLQQLRRGVAAHRHLGRLRYLTRRLCSLAEAQSKVGQAREGLATLAEALVDVEQTDEHLWEAELYRVQGEILLTEGNEEEAEANLHQAIDIARQQSAKSWELRATTSLARLWQAQGRASDARQALAEVYGWFTEGFDERDQQDARALLAELS